MPNPLDKGLFTTMQNHFLVAITNSEKKERDLWDIFCQKMSRRSRSFFSELVNATKKRGSVRKARPLTKALTNPLANPLTKALTNPLTKPLTNPLTKALTKPLTKPLTKFLSLTKQKL